MTVPGCNIICHWRHVFCSRVTWQNPRTAVENISSQNVLLRTFQIMASASQTEDTPGYSDDENSRLFPIAPKRHTKIAKIKNDQK